MHIKPHFFQCTMIHRNFDTVHSVLVSTEYRDHQTNLDCPAVVSDDDILHSSFKMVELQGPKILQSCCFPAHTQGNDWKKPKNIRKRPLLRQFNYPISLGQIIS